MKTQGWLLGALAIVVLLAVTNAATWHVSAVYTESGWQAREAKINADAAKLIEAAGTRVRDAERTAAVNLAAVDAYYQTKLQGKDDALIFARRVAATRGMFVNATCPAPGGNATGAIAAGPGVDNGTARVRLSNEDADFLITEAARADKVTDQLTACQAVVRTDRERKL